MLISTTKPPHKLIDATESFVTQLPNHYLFGVQRRFEKNSFYSIDSRDL